MKSTLAVLSLLAGLFLAGCAEQNTEVSTSIVGSKWRLQSVQREGSVALSVSASEEYTIEFAGATKVTGLNLCNHYGAKYGLGASSQVAFSEYVATEMACPTTSSSVEFSNLLLSAVSLQASDSRLTINTEGGHTLLSFTRVQ